jgi:hypothetical protein
MAAHRCRCGKEYVGGICAHCDAVPACCVGERKSCQWCVNAAHVCLVCRTVCDSREQAEECEKADRAVEIRQARESA